MTFTKPTPLEDALKLLREKRRVPTALSSADLRELAAEVKRAALFGARMTQIRPLQALLEGLTAMLEGKGNVADAKLLMTEVYAALGYDPEAGGFPQDKPGTVPPALRGSLRDLSSQKRMELTITTNYRMVANEAFVKRTTEDEQRRYQFPCYELVRIGPRRTPRGFVRRNGALKPVPGEDWPARFVAAGGELYERGTRMIAPKGSDVWIKLGEGAGGYKDTLGNPFAPFAFGSGYGLREVPRAECLLIGVIEEGDEAAKMPVTLQKALKAQAKQIDPKILSQFDDLELEDDGEWLRLAREKRAKAEAAYQMRNRLRTAAALMNGGTRAGALLGWITRRMGKMFAGQAYDKVLGLKKPQKARLKSWRYKKVDSAEAARIEAATGYDVAGHYHALDHSALLHIHKQHGDARKETLRGQYAVTRDHIARLHQLHSDPKVVIKAGKPLGDGTRIIEYKWRRGGKTHHLVEEVRADTLVPRTYFITNRRGLVVMAMDAPPAKESPSKTSGADHDLTQAATVRGRCKLLAAALSSRISHLSLPA